MPPLVFDGDCGFCTSVARHFEKRSFTPLTIVAWKLSDLNARGLTEEQASSQVYLVTERSHFAGARFAAAGQVIPCRPQPAQLLAELVDHLGPAYGRERAADLPFRERGRSVLN